MNFLELCKSFVDSLDEEPGSKPLRTFVHDDGDFSIEEDDSDEGDERSTGYVDASGRRESMHATRWRQAMLGAVAREAWVED